VLQGLDAALEAIQADLAGWYDQASFADAVHRLSAYRGITRLGALTLASEDRGSSRQGGCLDALHAPHRGMVLPRRAGRRVLAYLRGLLGLSEAGSFLNENAMLPGLQPVIGC
jgi:hypothetical protein